MHLDEPNFDYLQMSPYTIISLSNLHFSTHMFSPVLPPPALSLLTLWSRTEFNLSVARDQRPPEVFTEPRVAARDYQCPGGMTLTRDGETRRQKALPISAPWFPQKWEERVNCLLSHMSPRTPTSP